MDRFTQFMEKDGQPSQGSSFLENDCLTIKRLLTVNKESRTQDVETNSILVPPSNLHQDFGNMLRDGEGPSSPPDHRITKKPPLSAPNCGRRHSRLTSSTAFHDECFVVKDNIDTDQIIPVEYLTTGLSKPDKYRKLSSFAFWP
ncbi:hypothetical protein ZWY2020_051180 [Hordeum vulgare]|nr:hypothetical protein ZWY2020_051180 [Hordeum vulgare]